MISKRIRIFSIILLMVLLYSGCEKENEQEIVEQKLDFSVVEDTRLPGELLLVLQEKKTLPFKMTYLDGQDLYICIGYGEQKSGGYSICVNACSLLKNAILVDTGLIGPKPEDRKREVKSYPYIVIKTKDQGLPVVFA